MAKVTRLSSDADAGEELFRTSEGACTARRAPADRRQVPLLRTSGRADRSLSLTEHCSAAPFDSK
jgi:hypothetical protein